MCTDENSAPHAVRYLNAQLAVLHENAERCLQEHPNARTEKNKHFYALAEFAVQRPASATQIPSENDSLFYASFHAPDLKFICDHDVFLKLSFANGHIAVDSPRSGRSQIVPFPADFEVTYRVSFRTRRIVGNDQKIGDYGSAIELVILDLDSKYTASFLPLLLISLYLTEATLYSVEPELPSGRDQLTRFMTQYLELLHSAGNHVLFSLPQFDQRAAPGNVKYSLIGETEAYYEWMESMHGVTVDQINGYMSSIWLKSAMLARGSMTSDSTDWRPRCLAEFTRSEGDIHFRMQLGAPMVKILCEREIVIWFDIDELEIFEDGDFSAAPDRRFSGWKVAMVVNAIYNRDAAGHTVTIVFDLSNARYHKALSSYPGLDETDDITLDYYDLIIAFFSEEYLQILYNAHYHILYSHDTRWETIRKMRFDSQEDSDGSWWSLELGDSSGVSSRETIQRTKMFGFDQVTAVSQGSLNAQFSATSYVAFHSWAFESYFSASYKPFSLHLLSNNRALVWVHLANGNLKTLKDWALWDGSEQYEFRDWRVAFEVDLKMCSQSELEGATSTTYTSSQQFERHGHMADRELRHIYLDFQHAEYVHDYSNFGDIKNMGGDSRSLILKLQAVVFYLTQHYFPALCKDGMNVITSIPVWKEGHRSLPSYALTDVTFHVYSKVEITRHNWTQVTPGQEPIIVVLGTTGGRPLPSPELEFSTGWIVHANRGFSHGTIGIARRVFIEERLLTLLSNVNSYTTMIPVLLDPSQGFHGLSLKKWSEHDQRKDRPSKWELLPSDGEGCLKYLWEHCEEWRYKLRGNSNLMSSTQGISCVTRNYVELPTAVKQGALHIKISGKVELSLTLQVGKSESQTASSSVSWSTNVTVQTIGSGIKVNTLGSHDPVFAKGLTPDNAARFRSPMDMLREAFPDKVDLDELVQEIRAFEGPWQYCYPLANPYSLASPVFNDDGDLLFELRRHGVSAIRVTSATSPPAARIGRSSSPAFGRRAHSRTRQSGGRTSPAPHSPTRSPGRTKR
ncbi:uncharacterized protein TRAVEDRAFT_122355 [Trametes versicolor FP-101664 SS1]|uniref:uncharacterized protein n=1 Tax=Trametes versicolor (strain FP-101664) TaxID=717944 RepID=UPI0004621AFB|nr:uncharacterized protein TRAVEDRAFT_122355 [Trametes versicolor FP-101664 SS1]EIW59592.1 hypothetical protein TRAVEDRAFT_122355 [Trametes versicolor FP-101664 SS1]